MGRRKLSERTTPQWAPRYWPSWMIVGITWLLAQIPRAGQRALCRGISNLLFKIGSSRIKTIRRNIELCFPELSKQEQLKLATSNFSATLLTLFDLLNVVWHTADKTLGHTEVRGLENLKKALAGDKPLLLVSGHFTSFINGIFKISEFTPINVVYRRMDNPVLENQLYQRAARKYPITPIHRKEIKHMLETLGNQGAVVIVPDQDFGPKRSSFIPFFGIPTATITAIPQYAQETGAAVLIFEIYPADEPGKCILEISPALDNFPSGDDLADTQRWSDWLEGAIRKRPDNYFWLHKRFKTRPPGEKNLY